MRCHCPPLIDQAHATLGAHQRDVLADAGYRTAALPAASGIERGLASRFDFGLERPESPSRFRQEGVAGFDAPSRLLGLGGGSVDKPGRAEIDLRARGTRAKVLVVLPLLLLFLGPV